MSVFKLLHKKPVLVPQDNAVMRFVEKLLREPEIDSPRVSVKIFILTVIFNASVVTYIF